MSIVTITMYQGYEIRSFDDGLFDILLDGELVDGEKARARFHHHSSH